MTRFVENLKIPFRGNWKWEEWHRSTSAVASIISSGLVPTAGIYRIKKCYQDTASPVKYPVYSDCQNHRKDVNPERRETGCKSVFAFDCVGAVSGRKKKERMKVKERAEWESI